MYCAHWYCQRIKDNIDVRFTWSIKIKLFETKFKCDIILWLFQIYVTFYKIYEFSCVIRCDIIFNYNFTYYKQHIIIYCTIFTRLPICIIMYCEDIMYNECIHILYIPLYHPFSIHKYTQSTHIRATITNEHRNYNTFISHFTVTILGNDIWV